MNAPAQTLEHPLERTGDFTSTITLVGQVIALQGTRIARELARPRPNRAAIAELQNARSTAVALCRTLAKADAATLDEVRETYAALFVELSTGLTPLGGSGA